MNIYVLIELIIDAAVVKYNWYDNIISITLQRLIKIDINYVSVYQHVLMDSSKMQHSISKYYHIVNAAHGRKDKQVMQWSYKNMDEWQRKKNVV